MAQKNHVKLTGKLGFDPEIREIDTGRRVARMSLATSERFKNADGELVDDTQWHTVVAWGSTANKVADQLTKGMNVTIEGRLVYRSYEGKDGSKRYVTEIVMSDFTILPTP